MRWNKIQIEITRVTRSLFRETTRIYTDTDKPKKVDKHEEFNLLPPFDCLPLFSVIKNIAIGIPYFTRWKYLVSVVHVEKSCKQIYQCLWKKLLSNIAWWLGKKAEQMYHDRNGFSKPFVAHSTPIYNAHEYNNEMELWTSFLGRKIQLFHFSALYLLCFAFPSENDSCTKILNQRPSLLLQKYHL